MKHAIMLLVVASFSCCQSAYIIGNQSLPKKLSSSPSINLMDSDGQSHNVADIYQRHTAVVIFFWQIGCPCVKRYQQRIQGIFNRYQKKNIAIMFVSSNMNESFSEAKTEYQKRHLTLPLMRDEGGKLAKMLGAKGTPTAAIISQQGELIFLGWIDNERYEQEVGRIAYLENALNEYLDSQAISVNNSPMFGCSIE